MGLLLEGIHPRSSALGGSTVVVAIEQSQGLAVLVDNLEHAHVRMIGRNVGALLEGESVHQIGCIEHTIDQHAVDIEIRLHLIVRDVEQGLLHLGRIVETVVGLEVEIGTLALSGKVLDGLGLSIGLGRIFLDQVLQEGIDILRSLGHRVLQGIGSIAGIAHQLGLLSTQLGNLANNLKRVVLSLGTIGTMNGGFKDPLAQVAIVEAGKDSLLGGVDNDDCVRRLASTTLGIFLALGNVSIAQACQVFLLIDPNHSVVGSSLELVAPLLLQVGDAQVDFLHTLHLILGQQRALANEILVDFLEQFLVFALQRIVLFIIDLLDTLEEGFVERNLILQVGQHGLNLLLNLANLRSLVGIHQGEERASDTVEQLATILERQDGVLERSRVRTIHNLLDVLALLLDTSLEGREIIGRLNLAEIRRTKGQRTLCQQRVLARILLAGVKC